LARPSAQQLPRPWRRFAVSSGLATNLRKTPIIRSGEVASSEREHPETIEARREGRHGRQRASMSIVQPIFDQGP
jgi:hypothetical protein